MFLISPASPGPLGVPFQCTATETINSGALATRGCLIAAPKVVVDSVSALNLVVPLTAEVGALWEGRSRGARCRQSKSSGAGKRKERRELHGGCITEQVGIEKKIFRLWTAKSSIGLRCFKYTSGFLCILRRLNKMKRGITTICYRRNRSDISPLRTKVVVRKHQSFPYVVFVFDKP